MSWQLAVLTSQLALGGALLLGGMRKAIYDHNTGKSSVWGGIAMMLVGALLLLLVHPMIGLLAQGKPT